MGDNAEAAADLADLANLEVYNDPDGGAGLSEIKAPPLKPSGRPPRTGDSPRSVDQGEGTWADEEETPKRKTLAEVRSENDEYRWLMRGICIFFLQIPPVLVFGLCFAEMGYGHEVYRAIGPWEPWARPIQYVCGGMCVLLYIFDVGWWDTGVSKVMRVIFAVLIICGFGTSAVFAFTKRPYLPITVFMMIVPAYFWMLKAMVWPKLHISNFLVILGPVLAITGAVCLIVVLVWTAKHEFWWTHRTQAHFTCLLLKGQTGHANDLCIMPPIPNNTNSTLNMEGDVCGDSYSQKDQECQAAFVLWGGQYMATSLLILFGSMSFVIGTSQRKTVDDMDALTPAHKIFMYLILIGCMGMWIAAQIGGTELQLANLVTIFSGMLIVGTVIIMIITVGRANIDKSLHDIPLFAKMEAAGTGSGMRSLLMLVAIPVFPIIIVLSFLNQLVRRSPIPCTKKLDTDLSYWLTEPVQLKLNAMVDWPWTRVLGKMIWITFAYVLLAVGGGKFTNVGLGALNIALSPLGPFATTAIFFCMGVLMFMAPPIPGPPIYLTGGIVLVGATEEMFGFVGAVCYACVNCVVIKICAAACQQKLIGQRLKHRVGVRKLVGINSVPIQAVRRILMTPGLSVSKVMILIGGPDWPTSVLAGILGTNVWQMMLGTIPIAPVVSLCVTAGAFQLKKDLGPTWSAMSSVFLTLATVTGTLCLTLAAVEIENHSSKHREEIELYIAEQGDKQVAELERREALLRKQEKFATAWHKVPCFIKFALILGAGCSAGSLYLMIGFGSRCFASVGVMTPFGGPPLNGNLLNMFKWPFGVIAMSMHGFSLLCMVVYKIWAGQQTNPDVLSEPLSEETPNPASNDQMSVGAIAALESLEMGEVTNELSDAEASLESLEIESEARTLAPAPVAVNQGHLLTLE